MILFEKKYQTFDTVFHHQMKHCISCLIYYLKHANIIQVFKNEDESDPNNYRPISLLSVFSR